MVKGNISNEENNYIVNAFLEINDGCFLVNIQEDYYYTVFAKNDIPDYFEEKGAVTNSFIPSVQRYSLKKDFRKIESFIKSKMYSPTAYMDFLNSNHDYCRLSKVCAGDNLMIIISKAECDEKITVLNKLAYFDTITDGYNFNFFKERLVEFEKIDGCIIAMNIRGFQVINSIIGIENGNVMIKRISQIIDSSLHENEYSAHIAGDQFVIFLTEIERSTITRRLEEVARQIKQIKINGMQIDIESRFGVISWNGYSNVEITYSNAKGALHLRKSDDKSVVTYFDYNLESIVRDQKEFERNFEKSIENGDFEIMYQPKYDSVTEKIIEAEALVRWNYNGKVIMPNDFIPLFESNGMISVLDEYVFDKVCGEIRAQKDKKSNVVPISVNLSRKSLYKKDIVETLSTIAAKYDVERELIPIEITETAELERKRFQEVDKEFKQAGFLLQMDDFGTGYCSLESLLEMDFDTLKLDKTIVDHIHHDSGKTLVEYSVALAKNMGMKVTAEGVETLDQLVALRNLGCDNIQGYYFSKPLVKDEFYKLINR